MTEAAPPRLRVAMLGAFPPQTQGIQNYCGHLAYALASYCDVTAHGFARMYPPFLFPGVKQTIDRTRPSIERDGLRVRNKLTYYNPLAWLWTALTTPADVIHIQWWSLPLLPVSLTFAFAAKLRGKRLVVTVHNVLPHEGSRFFMPASRLLCRLADSVIVHGVTSAEHAEEHLRLPRKKIRAVAMGMTSSFIEPRDKAACREKLGLSFDHNVILFFGIIRDYKGLDILINSVARLAQDDPAYRLVIAGKPWSGWEQYAQQITTLGLEDHIVAFPDYIPEERVPVLFSAADLVALPYRHFNAQSGVAAVSLPYKKPTIVSRTGELPESVDKQDAWIAEPDDVESLTDRIRMFFSDIETNTRAFESIAETVCREMSWDSVAQKHCDVYGGERT